MKKRLICLLILATLSLSTIAQKEATQLVAPAKLELLIDSITTLLKDKYISEAIGAKMAAFIQEQHRQFNYQQLTYKQLGQRLTTDLRAVNEDVHMSAFYRKKAQTPQKSLLEIKLGAYGATSNFGYVETKIMEGNIGYLRIDHFTNWDYFEQAKIAATRAVNTIQHTDALIIDVRDNPGGFEDIVAHFMSHFFAGEAFELQQYHCRYLDYSRSIYTNPAIQGAKLPDLPIYILVNEHTASAAESLAYMMKHFGRATIIGATTAGAGNGASQFRVSDEFVLQIATWETINAVTKTSWEKVGVAPTIAVADEVAFERTVALAKEAAKSYKAQKMKADELLLVDLDRTFQEASSSVGMLDSLLYYLQQAQQQGLYNESKINQLGYSKLRESNNKAMAEVIFKANVLLYPESANVYDSYAEVLAVNQKMEEAHANYKKAVRLAQQQGHPDVQSYKENLARFEQQLIKEKK